MASVAYIPIVLGLIGLLAAFGFYRSVLSYPEGTGKVVEIASQIHRGALVFMRREYLYLVIFVIVVGAVILVSDLGWPTTVAFLVGALSSATAGLSACTRPLRPMSGRRRQRRIEEQRRR